MAVRLVREPHHERRGATQVERTGRGKLAALPKGDRQEEDGKSEEEEP